MLGKIGAFGAADFRCSIKVTCQPANARHRTASVVTISAVSRPRLSTPNPAHFPTTSCLPENPVAAANWFRYAYLAHFASPKGDRQLFRTIKREQVCRIVEIGIGGLARAEALIQVAQRFAGEKKVWYTGFDMFEARPTGQSPIALKDAYCRLRATEANIRLVPGVPRTSLPSAANAHPNTDLVIVGATFSESDIQGGWHYVPRMLHERSVILSERRTADSQVSFTPISRTQIAEWAARDTNRRAA